MVRRPRRAFLRLDGGSGKARLARGCGGLANLLQRGPRLRRPPQSRPQAAKLAALHPLLHAAQDLEARGWAAQEDAEEPGRQSQARTMAQCKQIQAQA